MLNFFRDLVERTPEMYIVEGRFSRGFEYEQTETSKILNSIVTFYFNQVGKAEKVQLIFYNLDHDDLRSHMLANFDLSICRNTYEIQAGGVPRITVAHPLDVRTKNCVFTHGGDLKKALIRANKYKERGFQFLIEDKKACFEKLLATVPSSNVSFIECTSEEAFPVFNARAFIVPDECHNFETVAQRSTKCDKVEPYGCIYKSLLNWHCHFCCSSQTSNETKNLIFYCIE